MWEEYNLTRASTQELSVPRPLVLGDANSSPNKAIFKEARQHLKRGVLLLYLLRLNAVVSCLLTFPFVKSVLISFNTSETVDADTNTTRFTASFVRAQLKLYNDKIRESRLLNGFGMLELLHAKEFFKACFLLYDFGAVSLVCCAMSRDVTFHCVWGDIVKAQLGPVIN